MYLSLPIVKGFVVVNAELKKEKYFKRYQKVQCAGDVELVTVATTLQNLF